MKIGEAAVVWTPGTDKVRVERKHSNWQRTAETVGCQPTDPNNDLLGMFILFNTVTVRDGVEVQAAHKAFLEIDEYRKAISPDTTGAE